MSEIHILNYLKLFTYVDILVVTLVPRLTKLVVLSKETGKV